jgi:hypothetical protein
MPGGRVDRLAFDAAPQGVAGGPETFFSLTLRLAAFNPESAGEN